MKIFKDKTRGYLNLDAIAVASVDDKDPRVLVVQLVSGSLIRLDGEDAKQLKEILEASVIN
jgi:hypothetical protein